MVSFMQTKIKSIYYQLKGISYFIWIPPIILYILLPILHYTIYSHEHDMDMVYSNILDNTQYIIPLFSIWYTLFLLYHFVEQPGCELLYVTETFKLPNLLLAYLLYVILMLPLFIGYTYLFSEFWWLYIKLCVVNLMYTMLVYAFTYTFRQIIPGILFILFYSFIGFLGDSDGIGRISYYCYELNTGYTLFGELKPILIVIFLLFIWGLIANYYFTKNGNYYK